MSYIAELALGLRSRKTNAISAFLTKNPAASRAVHANLYDEPHKTNNVRNLKEKYLESILKSAEKGLLQSCIVVSVLAGIYHFLTSSSWSTKLITDVSTLSKSTILQGYTIEFIFVMLGVLIGFATLFSHGLILGYCEYQSSKEYREFYHSERRRETWEYDNYIEGEQNEMIQLYVQRGLSKDDAETVIKLLSKNKKFFVDVMMKEELELLPPDERDPLTNGLVTFASFLGLGCVPLLPYFSWSAGGFYMTILYTSLAFAVGALFVCGAIKSVFSFSLSKWWKVGLQMSLNGLIAFASGLFATAVLLLLIERIL